MKPTACPYCNSTLSLASNARHWWFSCGTYVRQADQKTVQMTDLCQERQQLTEAWEIINVLTMMDIDRKEPWPRALEWLKTNEIHRKPPSMLAEVGRS